MAPEDIQHWKSELTGKTPRKIIRWAGEQFGRKLVQGTGLGAEDQLITHLLASDAPDTAVVFVDTGRHFQQTHELLQETRERYDLDIRLTLPDGEELEQMLHDEGPNLFHRGEALRRRCCAVRKHDPLKRALAPFDVWLSGRRRRQGPERAAVDVIEWDAANEMVRINPLWDWDDKQLWDYLRMNHVPVHELHQQGYAFPGCAPCTRALKPGEPPCAGRWWWEGEAKTLADRSLCV